jgi:hypothetical protein
MIEVFKCILCPNSSLAYNKGKDIKLNVNPNTYCPREKDSGKRSISAGS